jgi:fatty-acyl-CoA synthase
MQQNKTLDFEDVQDDRVAAYFHTGGTTGMPKVAQHLYSGMIYNGWLGHRLLFSETDNVICPLPLFHVFASHVILMAMVPLVRMWSSRHLRVIAVMVCSIISGN